MRFLTEASAIGNLSKFPYYSRFVNLLYITHRSIPHLSFIFIDYFCFGVIEEKIEYIYGLFILFFWVNRRFFFFFLDFFLLAWFFYFLFISLFIIRFVKNFISPSPIFPSAKKFNSGA